LESAAAAGRRVTPVDVTQHATDALLVPILTHILRVLSPPAKRLKMLTNSKFCL